MEDSLLQRLLQALEDVENKVEGSFDRMMKYARILYVSLADIGAESCVLKSDESDADTVYTFIIDTNYNLVLQIDDWRKHLWYCGELPKDGKRDLHRVPFSTNLISPAQVRRLEEKHNERDNDDSNS